MRVGQWRKNTLLPSRSFPFPGVGLLSLSVFLRFSGGFLVPATPQWSFTTPSLSAFAMTRGGVGDGGGGWEDLGKETPLNVLHSLFFLSYAAERLLLLLLRGRKDAGGGVTGCGKDKSNACNRLEAFAEVSRRFPLRLDVEATEAGGPRRRLQEFKKAASPECAEKPERFSPCFFSLSSFSPLFSPSLLFACRPRVRRGPRSEQERLRHRKKRDGAPSKKSLICSSGAKWRLSLSFSRCHLRPNVRTPSLLSTPLAGLSSRTSYAALRCHYLNVFSHLKTLSSSWHFSQLLRTFILPCESLWLPGNHQQWYTLFVLHLHSVTWAEN